MKYDGEAILDTTLLLYNGHTLSLDRIISKRLS